jgi:DNA-binding CsgD family transcriptional regulator
VGSPEPSPALPMERPEQQALARAVNAVSGPDVSDGLRAVADEAPLALSVDFINIRLLGSDRNLHLVAASGCSSVEVRKRAFQPMAVASAREAVASGGHAKVARSLGIEWLDVAWMRTDGEDVGTIAVGSRTKRRPDESELALLRAVATALAERVRHVDTQAATLRAASVRLARTWTPYEWPGDGASGRLRPRERAILELYADGLSTSDIATLLVISPHTVRTHVKLAMRRLGVHERGAAETLVRADQIGQVL